MKKRSLLDSYAVLAWLQDEAGAQKVEDLFYAARKGGHHLLISVVNLGEVYYNCIRRKGRNYADGILQQLHLLPLDVIPCSYELTMEAAAIKAGHPISYADCFATATAIMENAVVVTGDPDFKAVKGLVKIDWV